MNYIGNYKSPLGTLAMLSDGQSLTGITFDSQMYAADIMTGKYEKRQLSIFKKTSRWLDIYFQGGCPDFTPPIKLTGTSFRRAVWDILLTIPYGQTISYGEIAAKIADRMGKSRMSAQAVGGAVGKNPLPIIVPCHRVIGKDGSLTGYAGGLWRKKFLLELEAYRCYSPASISTLAPRYLLTSADFKSFW